MAEFDNLMESVKDKTEGTQKAYKSQYKKLRRLLDDEDIGLSSQRKLIGIINEEENINQQQALLNIAILVRRLDKLNTKELEKQRDKNKGQIVNKVKENNKKFAEKEGMPSIEDLEDFTEYLWDKGEWTDYVINYLLLNYQVRNADLNFDIVKFKRDTKDDEKNYMWVSKNGFVDYIRNVYKTSGTYGRKVIKIKDPKFHTAMRRILGCQKSNLDCGVFIPNENQVGYYIKKATYKGIGEANYLKIVIDANRGDLQKLKEISDNRGTSLDTLLSNYDIKKV